jgi:hypothetical protein
VYLWFNPTKRVPKSLAESVLVSQSPDFKMFEVVSPSGAMKRIVPVSPVNR